MTNREIEEAAKIYAENNPALRNKLAHFDRHLIEELETMAFIHAAKWAREEAAKKVMAHPRQVQDGDKMLYLKLINAEELAKEIRGSE